ncbi:MAG: hypothetical protein QXL22_06385 [Candidatus Nezhaarchaeales archaeon]
MSAPGDHRRSRGSTVSKFGNTKRADADRGAQGRAQMPRRSEFDHEYEGRTVRVTLHNGTVVIGRAETSKYWLKIQTTGSKHIYVNKAFIVMIEPAE